eukprot:6203754-Pleurochrysis_carterae.AAC.2
MPFEAYMLESSIFNYAHCIRPFINCDALGRRPFLSQLRTEAGHVDVGSCRSKLAAREEMVNVTLATTLKRKNIHDTLARFTEVAGPSSRQLGTITYYYSEKRGSRWFCSLAGS